MRIDFGKLSKLERLGVVPTSLLVFTSDNHGFGQSFIDIKDYSREHDTMRIVANHTVIKKDPCSEQLRDKMLDIYPGTIIRTSSSSSKHLEAKAYEYAEMISDMGFHTLIGEDYGHISEVIEDKYEHVVRYLGTMKGLSGLGLKQVPSSYLNKQFKRMIPGRVGFMFDELLKLSPEALLSAKLEKGVSDSWSAELKREVYARETLVDWVVAALNGKRDDEVAFSREYQLLL